MTDHTFVIAMGTRARRAAVRVHREVSPLLRFDISEFDKPSSRFLEQAGQRDE